MPRFSTESFSVNNKEKDKEPNNEIGTSKSTDDFLELFEIIFRKLFNYII